MTASPLSLSSSRPFAASFPSGAARTRPPAGMRDRHDGRTERAETLVRGGEGLLLELEAVRPVLQGDNREVAFGVAGSVEAGEIVSEGDGLPVPTRKETGVPTSMPPPRGP